MALGFANTEGSRVALCGDGLVVTPESATPSTPTPGPRTLVGTREAGASVVVTLTGPVNATLEIGPGDSSWSVVTASLPVGTYQVSAHATDVLGNEAFAGPVIFSVTATCGGAGACDDGNPCTADRGEVLGCVNEALPGDSACGDGDVCDGSTTAPTCVECTSDAQCGELDCDEARNVCDDLTPPAVELVSPEAGAVFEAREVATRGQTEPATTVLVTVTNAAGNSATATSTFTVAPDPTDPTAGFTVQGGGFAPLAVLGLVLVALRRRLRAFRHHNSA